MIAVSPVSIREATAADAAACREIYAHYVTDTVITFEYEVPTSDQMAARIEAAHAWLVAERDDRVVGYAYAGPHKARAAYDWSCEVSVYLAPGLRRTGAGRALYEALFAVLRERGYAMTVAGITLPNPASEGLHAALGFEPVGVFRRIGWKFDAWHDVYWCQRAL